MDPLLETKGLSRHFGGLVAVDRVNLDVRPMEIVALIGPNGAGKTTFFNCITGIYPPTTGEIYARPPENPLRRLDGLKPNQVTEIGLARTFQNIRLFPTLTVLENVLIGRHCRMKAWIIGAIWRDKQTRAEERQAVTHCHDLLVRFGLEKYINELAKNLPYGVQRRLEIVRALATSPFLLLLDEPAAGLNIAETRELDLLIRRIRQEEKIAILLIEHDMSLVMSLSERIFVMDYGQLISSGTPQEVQSDPRVIKAYLGEDLD